MEQGRLIVLEGLDGSGKATQTGLLCRRLEAEGIPVNHISFPNYAESSSALVKSYLAGEFGGTPDAVNAYAASSFYAVDRYAAYLKHWRADYENGVMIVADRYTTSNAIYQMTKLPREEWDTFLDWLEEYEYRLLALPRPDRVIYLDMPPEVSQRLMSERYGGNESRKDIHEADVTFQRACRESALYAARRLDWQVVACGENGVPRAMEAISHDVWACL